MVAAARYKVCNYLSDQHWSEPVHFEVIHSMRFDFTIFNPKTLTWEGDSLDTVIDFISLLDDLGKKTTLKEEVNLRLGSVFVLKKKLICILMLETQKFFD